MPWYPSAKACPAAIKPTVQCFFPTLYQVLFFDFSSFGEKLFFCLRGYAAQSREARCKNSRSAERGCSSVYPPPNRRRMGGGSNLAPPPTGYAAQSREARCKNSRSAERGCSSVHPPPNRRRMGGGDNLAPPPTGYRRAIARSAVQKQPERRALRPQARFGAQPPQAALGAEIGCSSVHPPPNRRRMGGGSNLGPHQQAMPRNRAKRGAKTAGAQSAAPAGAFRSATAAGGTWRGDRMFLCSPAAEQAANG